MNCYSCSSTEGLIWGGDHDVTESVSEHTIETNLSCAKCGAFYLVYHGNKENDIIMTNTREDNLALLMGLSSLEE